MKEKIKQIKYFRLKPEERFLVDVLNKIVEVKDEYYIFYKYKGDIIFRYCLETNNFYVNYGKIWSELQFKYNVNINEISNLIKNMVEQYINLKNITPIADTIFKW